MNTPALRKQASRYSKGLAEKTSVPTTLIFVIPAMAYHVLRTLIESLDELLLDVVALPLASILANDI